MPDHELIQLIQNSSYHIGDTGQNILVGIFGYLTACYLAAGKLNWLVFWTLTFVYLFYSYINLTGIYYSADNLMVFMREAASRPSLTSEMELYAPENVAAAERAMPLNVAIYSIAIVVSVVIGYLLKAGKLRV